MGVALSTSPFHPTTGLQALGLNKRGLPIWPVMGGSEDATAEQVAAAAAAAATAAQQQGGQGGQQQNGGQADQGQSGGSDTGFPPNTPVKDMTVEQQAAYYKHQNRQADNKLGAFKGRTPQQVQDMETELETLRDKDRTAGEKATKEAEKAARAAADAEWRPKLQTAQLRAIASDVLKGDQLDAWLSGVNPAAFAGEAGDIDQDKVKAYLTAAFGVGGQDGQQQQSNGRQQAPAWGQHSGGAGTPPARPGEAGKAAAEKRFGTTT